MSTRAQFLCACAVMLLAWVSLYLWRYMPIYPDEVAMRFQLGRYFADKGVVTGLYALCTSNVKTTPFLFILPAQIVAFADLHLSLVQARIFPVLTVIGIVLCTLRYALRGRNPWAALLIASAFIGVAGSSLVMARYELFFEINLLACLTALCVLDSVRPAKVLCYATALVVLIASLLSAYAHIQGLLLLPLSAWLIFRLLGTRHRWQIGAGIALAFAAIVATTLSFQHSSCAEYPEIEAFWRAMTVSPARLALLDLRAWLVGSFDQYAQAFLYKPAYQADYLFGLLPGDAFHEHLKQLFNQAIGVVLLINLLAVASLALVGSCRLAWTILGRTRNGQGKDFSQVERTAFSILLAWPVLFLLLYDSAHNFYRSIFLNLLVAVVIAIYGSFVASKFARRVMILYAALCCSIAVVSCFSNANFFSTMLSTPPGYEGHGLSVHRDWNALGRDVDAVAQACHIDLRKGRIIMDDLTYSAVKEYPALYPITYMSLQAGLVHDARAAIIKVGARAVIARCAMMKETEIGIPYQQRHGELCCFNYSEEKASNGE